MKWPVSLPVLLQAALGEVGKVDGGDSSFWERSEAAAESWRPDGSPSYSGGRGEQREAERNLEAAGGGRTGGGGNGEASRSCVGAPSQPKLIFSQ